MATKRRRKRWQFCWADEASPPANGDAHTWHSKVIRAATFERAMDRMLDYVNGKPFRCVVDYEAAALHVPYRADRHARHFPRIDLTDHPLREHLD